MQLCHICHIAIRQDLVIAPVVAGAIEEHAQAQGLAGLVNSLDGLRGVCD